MPISGPATSPVLPVSPTTAPGPAVVDPVGLILAELRANPGVISEVGSKVWGGEIPDKVAGVTVPADPRPYVLVRRLGVSRMRVPVQGVRITVISVHKSPRLAARLYGLCSPVLHQRGPRISATGVAIYFSNEEVGGQPSTDPVTGWPSEAAVYEVFAYANAVA